MDAFSPTSHSYISSRLKLHYVDWGNAGAPLVVLVHGGLDHCRSWDWTARRLQPDWHVVAIDLRGHGDSAWSSDGRYSVDSFVADLAQFLHQKRETAARIVAHSLGGHVASRYAAIYPEKVEKLVLVEGLGWSEKLQREQDATPLRERLRASYEKRRLLSGRSLRRYSSLESAIDRMREENPNLSLEQATHLTRYGVSQNEDGSYSWKFDNYARLMSPCDLDGPQIQALWRAITCPTLLMYGLDSWATSPRIDGRIDYFNYAHLIEYERAGHWPHHDRFETFITDVRAFLAD